MRTAARTTAWGALRSNQFGIGDDGVNEYVQSISEQTGEFLQIVNYNLSGSQYVVAGTVAGLKALGARRRAPCRRVWRTQAVHGAARH